jgi:hypothetical protein
VAFVEKANLLYTGSNFALRLAEAHLRAGDRAAARRRLDTVLGWVGEPGYRHLQGMALRLLGECLAPDDPVEAEERLALGRQILERAGAADEVARVDVTLAELRRAAGDAGEARRLLEGALATFETLGTLDQIARTQRLLAELDGAAPARPPLTSR